MNSRERMLAAIHHQRSDRVPTDIWATAEVMAKLHRHFGANEEAMKRLHIDGMAFVDAVYAGPPLPAMPTGEAVNYWGMRYRRIAYATGTYDEQSFHPLAAARTIADLDRYAWPKPDWFDYSRMRATAESLHPHKAIHCGYMAPFYFHNQLRGLEQSLIDPLENPEFTRHLLKRLCDFFFVHHQRMFETCAGLIDIAQVTDDLGSQTGPLIGLPTFREFYKPHMQRFIDLCRTHNIKVFHHDDGAMRSFLPDLVAMGIDILNPVQWTCPGMELTALKQDFGRVLCFHGGVDNQKILPFGTPAQVRAEVRHCIDALASDNTGYILAPCHNIQAVTPLANILAMYDEAWKYGKF